MDKTILMKINNFIKKYEENYSVKPNAIFCGTRIFGMVAAEIEENAPKIGTQKVLANMFGHNIDIFYLPNMNNGIVHIGHINSFILGDKEDS